MMRDQLAETLVGAAVLGIAVVFLFVTLGSAGGTGGGGYPLRVTFDSASGLTVGSDVRLSGVKVGAVSDIALRDDYQAEVTFTVSRGIELPADTSVSLKSEGLLGGTYLSVEPGIEEEFLAAGDAVVFGQGSIDVITLLADFIQQLGDSLSRIAESQ